MRFPLGFAAACSFALVAFTAPACVGDDPAPAQSAGDDAGPANGGSDAAPPKPEAGADAAATNCVAPLADCDGNGSCETSTATEPKHCGVCGHDCKGGACVDGRCQAQTIAPNLDAPLSIAINSSGIFWLRAGVVQKCPKAGCVGAPTTLASSTTQSAVLGRRHVFANETKVYWLGDEASPGQQIFIYSCDVGGCGLSPTPLGEYTGVGQLVGNTTSLVWYDGTGSLKLVPLAGGAHQYLSLVYKESSFGFALDGNTLVFSNVDTTTNGAAGVWRGTAANVAPTKVMDKGRHVAIAGGTIFASVDVNATQSTVTSCAAAGCGGTGAALFPALEGTINDVVADATSVYWAVKGSSGAADGKIRTCKLPACAGGPTTVADNQANPFALALDGEFIYWANNGTGETNTGSIARARR